MDEQPTMASVIQKLREMSREDAKGVPNPKPKPLPDEVERAIRELGLSVVLRP